MSIADRRNREGSRASGGGMHLAVYTVMPANETTDSRHRRGPSPFAPPNTPTPKPSTTSRIGRGRGGASLHMGRWVRKLGEDIGRPEPEGW